FADTGARDWDEQLGAGLRGAFLCSREAFRVMRRRGGAIVMVSSLSGVAGAAKFPGMAAYVAAKSGLAGLTEALAVEGREFGIRVNAISPGAVDTAMLRVAGVAGPALSPAEVAPVVVWLASSESAPLTGAYLRIDAVDHRHLNRDVDFLRGVIPTAENVAMAAFRRLEPHFKPARLVKVRVVETENNAAEVTSD